MSAFDNTPETNQVQGESSTSEESNTPDYIQTLVETKGSVFSDPQAIAKSKIEADNYIEQLKAENERLKFEAEKEAYARQVLETASNQGADPTPAKQADNKGGTEETPTRVSESDIKSLVAEALTEREHTRTAEQNVAQVDKMLEESYGTEAGNAVRSRAAELGLSLERMKEVAQESPTAFMQMMGQAPAKQTHNVAQSTINTSAAASKPGGTRDWNYYRGLRKSDPKRYYSADVQKQIVNDRVAMGSDKFYNS
jgi:hypothetical protein